MNFWHTHSSFAVRWFQFLHVTSEELKAAKEAEAHDEERERIIEDIEQNLESVGSDDSDGLDAGDVVDQDSEYSVNHCGNMECMESDSLYSRCVIATTLSALNFAW